MLNTTRAKKLINTRIYAMLLVSTCVVLYVSIRVFQDRPDRIASAIIPGIFFAICLQTATYMLWKFRQKGHEKSYDSPTSILAMGSAVVFHQLGSTTVAFVCFMISCIVFAELGLKKHAEAIIKVAMGTIAMSSSILVFYVVDFNIDAPMQIFVTQIAFAAIVAGLTNRVMVSAQRYTTLDKSTPKDDQLASAFLRLLPLAILSGLLARYYFQFGSALLWAFAIPIILYYLLASSYIQIEASKADALATLVKALEAKDPYTAHHADRVAMFATSVGNELRFSKRRIEKLNHAALLHDIGKLIIPNEILNKPSELSEQEYKIVLRHDLVTAEVLKRIDFLSSTAKFAGLNYNSIEYMSDKYLEPHIIAACDAFDAMTSSRAYRKALTQETAIAELRRNVGTQFREDVVEALIKVLENSPVKYGFGFETDLTHNDAPTAGVGSAGLTYSESLLFQKRLKIKNTITEFDL